MEGMFFFCKSLIKLEISNFNTKKVKNMDSMFFSCASLKDLDISNFDLNLTYMGYMFDKCSDELKTKVKGQNKNIKDIAFETEDFYFF